jgi:amino acid transporter
MTGRFPLALADFHKTVTGGRLPPPGSCDRFPRVNRIRTSTAALLTALTALFFLATAQAASAADFLVVASGGRTDMFITLFCFGVIAFFAAFVIVMSLIQGRFDAKKEQRRHDLDRFNS